MKYRFYISGGYPVEVVAETIEEAWERYKDIGLDKDEILGHSTAINGDSLKPRITKIEAII